MNNKQLWEHVLYFPPIHFLPAANDMDNCHIILVTEKKRIFLTKTV